jgi:prepilin-type N-terminal cleavage/methylation domain-containing protein
MQVSRIPSRRALTMLEVLIAVAVIGILGALLLPAVQYVRESAARVQCMNNLQQLGMAVFDYHQITGYLPTNGGFPPTGQSFNLETNQPGESYDWGFGNPDRGGIDQPGSWAYAVLPYVDQEAAYKKSDQGAALKTYLCPTRGRQLSQVTPAADPGPVFVDWTYQTAGKNPWAKTDYAGNAAVILPRGKAISLEQITDGTSKTVLLGEKSMDPRAYNTGGWGWDEPLFTGGSSGTTRSGDRINQDLPGVTFEYNWGTPHTGVCFFLFADGSVRPISTAISTSTMHALMTPQGGEIIDLDSLLQ